jgi:hypothetical protein
MLDATDSRDSSRLGAPERRPNNADRVIGMLELGSQIGHINLLVRQSNHGFEMRKFSVNDFRGCAEQRPNRFRKLPDIIVGQHSFESLSNVRVVWSQPSKYLDGCLTRLGRFVRLHFNSYAHLAA